MADIELIPRDYRAQRQLRQWLQRLAVGLALLLLLAGGARAWLAWKLAVERPLVEQLRQGEQAAAQREARVAALRARKGEADVHRTGLREIREAAGWDRIFHAIDNAWSPGIWLESLAYHREIDLPAAAAPGGLPAAAAAAVPASAPEPRLRHRFELQGLAVAHPSVTEFMRALGGQAGVGPLSLAETRLRRQGSAEVVEFQLSGGLDPARKATP